MIQCDVFRDITGLLDKLRIPYMLSGCCASNYHGAPRATTDIDFVIAASAAQIKEFLKFLPANEYEFDLPSAIEAAQSHSMVNMIHDPSGWKIDLLFHNQSDFNVEKLRRRMQVEIEGIPIFIESPEDVLLSQLQWTKNGGPWRQIEDAAGILKVAGDDLDFEYIQRWVGQLELRSQWSAANKFAVLP